MGRMGTATDGLIDVVVFEDYDDRGLILKNIEVVFEAFNSGRNGQARIHADSCSMFLWCDPKVGDIAHY
jgi:hypothetical protein